jgi:hypothetical protein
MGVTRSSLIYRRMLWCSAVQCSAVQCSAVQCNAVQCYGAVQLGVVQCSAVQCGVMCSVVRQSTITSLFHNPQCRHCYSQPLYIPSNCTQYLTLPRGGGVTSNQHRPMSQTQVMDQCHRLMSWTQVTDPCHGPMSQTHVTEPCHGLMSWTQVTDPGHGPRGHCNTSQCIPTPWVGPLAQWAGPAEGLLAVCWFGSDQAVLQSATVLQSYRAVLQSLELV